MTARLTIAVQCHHFQKRLWWMLSSLACQTAAGAVIVDVAHVPGNGDPTTEEVCGLFPFARRRECPFDRSFQSRGLVRTSQLKDCRTEWLMFSDCDMVYHPEWVKGLLSELDAHHQDAPYMLSAGRISNAIADADSLVNAPAFRGYIIGDAFTRAAALPRIEMENVGAGYCQIVNVTHCPHAGYYVLRRNNPDWEWSTQGSNPKSDVQFRRRIESKAGPRQALPQWFTENWIHLNHRRDYDEKRHLEEQR